MIHIRVFFVTSSGFDMIQYLVPDDKTRVLAALVRGDAVVGRER